MKRLTLLLALVATLVLVLVPIPAEAQNVHRPIVQFKDVADASYTYCALSDDRTGTAAIQTSGSSTTINATSGTPFAGLGVGDVLFIRLTPDTGTVNVRRIVTYTSATLVVVDTAIDIATPVTFHYRSYQGGCGTGAESGWINVNGTGATLYVYVADLNATSIDYVVQYRSRPVGVTAGAATGYVQITPASISSEAAGSNTAVIAIPNTFEQVRLGLKITADGGVQDVTAVLSYTPSTQP